MQEPDACPEETRLWLRYAQKAVLVYLRRDVPRIHDLDVLIDALPLDWPLVQEYPDLANLTDWAVNARYPLAGQEPMHEDAEEAVHQAHALLDSVRRDLTVHGFASEPG